MKLGLTEKTAVVTGGSKGIGLAIAKELLSEGANVVITGRREDALQQAIMGYREMVGHKNSGKGELRYVCADATNAKDTARVVSQTMAWFGSLDILINNVGGSPTFGSLQQLELSDWQDSFDLNVKSMVAFVREAEAELLQAGERGFARIITVSSISGIQPGYYNPHYTTMKAATINLSKYLANIYADKGIRVTCVCPGPVYSESWDRNIQREADLKGIKYKDAFAEIDRTEAAKVPLGRIGVGEDIAGLVTFLASERSDWITGSCFHINGGKLAAIV